MGLILKTEKRRIIPQWRSIEIASSTGELMVSTQKTKFQKFNINYLSEQQQSFRNSRDISHAGDLLSSAYVLGLENEFKDVAKFILNNELDENSYLKKLAKNVLSIVIDDNNSQKKIDKQSVEQIRYRFDINRYRNHLHREPRNPIAWIELGRLYTLIGKIDKAKRCVDSALFLDSNNRFIVRSASRFYHHYDSDKDIALSIIKKSEFLKNDPWLLSAEIAYSSILGRRSTMAMYGADFIKNKKQNNFEVTELASALGTLEHSSGKTKDAKKYFNESLLKPNANSLAQISWMSNSIKGFDFDISKYNLPFAFEANAVASLENREYKISYENTIEWIKDEPYSTRPIKLASYISSIYLGNNEKSIELLKSGLIINPDDIMVNNDLVYYLVRGNRITEAIKIFNNKLVGYLNNTDLVSRLTLTATAGLLLYREGYREEGKKFYLNAIDWARQADNEYLVALATVNYAKEELKFIKSKNEISNLIGYLEKYNKIYDSQDIIILYNELLVEYNKMVE